MTFANDWKFSRNLQRSFPLHVLLCIQVSIKKPCNRLGHGSILLNFIIGDQINQAAMELDVFTDHVSSKALFLILIQVAHSSTFLPVIWEI